MSNNRESQALQVNEEWKRAKTNPLYIDKPMIWKSPSETEQVVSI